MTLGRWFDKDTQETCVCFTFDKGTVYVHYDNGYITHIPYKLFEKLTKNGSWTRRK